MGVAQIVVDESHKKQAEELRRQLQEAQRAATAAAEEVARLRVQNETLSKQRQQLMAMKDEDKVRFVAAELDRRQAELEAAQRQLRVDAAKTAVLEERERRRQKVSAESMRSRGLSGPRRLAARTRSLCALRR